MTIILLFILLLTIWISYCQFIGVYLPHLALKRKERLSTKEYWDNLLDKNVKENL